MKKPVEIGKLLTFLLRSANLHHIHSPFLYQLVDEVIRSRKPVPAGKAIEIVRHRYAGSREIILKTDFGRISGDTGHPAVYPVRQGHIARTSLTPRRHSRRLYRLARYFEAASILEIGTSLGITTAYLAMAQPGAKIITLEGCPELCRLAGENFSRLGISNVEIMTGPFSETLAPALERLGRIDLVYVDGNHSRKAVLEYFEKCMEYATNNTVMVFDDIRRSADMEEAWNTIIKRDEVRISLDLYLSGWIFFRRESSREHFKLRYI